MLWESVTGGLSLLKFGDIYIAALIYVIMYCVPLIVGSVIFDKSVVAGGIFLYTLAPLLQSFAVLVFVFSVSPILLGFSDSAIWGFPWEFAASEPWFIIKTIVMMLIVSVLLSLIPVLGTFSSFITFVMGAFALFTLLNNAPNFPAEHIIFFPDIFTSVGFVVISAFIGWAAFMLVGLILTGMGKDETWMPIVGIPLASTPGLVSILFYGAYLGSQL